MYSRDRRLYGSCFRRMRTNSCCFRNKKMGFRNKRMRFRNKKASLDMMSSAMTRGTGLPVKSSDILYHGKLARCMRACMLAHCMWACILAHCT